MKIVRYVIDDRGIVLIVEGAPTDEARAELRQQFDDWAQMVAGRHFPVLVLPGDERTQVTDLRTKP